MSEEVAPRERGDAHRPASSANRPVTGYYCNPEAGSVEDGVGMVADEPMLAAARTNRTLALNRISDARWGRLANFRDVTMTKSFHAGDTVAEVHGDASFGRQGPERQANEVLSLCNEMLRYGADGELHRFHRLLYAWALSFPVGTTQTFVVAANNFGRLRRLWPSAVFLERELAQRLDVPIAEEPGMEKYLGKLADKAEGHGPKSVLGLGSVISVLPNPFRDPVTSVRPRRTLDVRSIERRGLLAPAWVGGLVRARPFFDLTRWLPRRPSWWVEYGPSMETVV